MAIKTLIGNDLSSAASFVEGSALADGDTLVLAAYSFEVLTGPGVALTSTGINIICRPGCAIKLGTAFAFSAKVLSMVAQGSGAIIRVNGDVTKHCVLPGAEVVAMGGAWSLGHNAGGTMRYTSAATVVDHENIAGGTFVDSHGSDTIDNLRCSGGSVETKRTILNAKMGGPGLLRLLKSATIASGGSGVIEMHHPMAKLLVQTDGAITVDYLKCYAGIVDPEGMGGALTITNAIRTASSRIRNTYSASAIVYTNTPSDNGYNGQFAGGGSEI